MVQGNSVTVIDESSCVLEVGSAFGFNFDGNEHDLEVVVATREEEEDVLRLLEHQGGNLLFRRVGVDIIGTAGGLITLWNEELLSVEDFLG
ncbi:hypothetical protein QYF36_011569 [Acer negundo]|nr:hypothetical protein QYF36_011569 [Acer negundo]